MPLITHFPNLPPEILHNILENLEASHRLTFIQSSAEIELTIARDIGWFINLLVPSSARNVVLATIHAPQRGKREHIRQFRTRVKAFAADYQEGLFSDRLPNPYRTSTGGERKSAHPRVLQRFRDLLDLLRAVDLLLRDYVYKAKKSGLGWDGQYMSQHAVFSERVLDSWLTLAHSDHRLGVGFSLVESGHHFYDEAFQTSVLESFFRLELFRRLFYSNPLCPLFSSGDATPVLCANPVNCMTPRDTHTHGFATQWDNIRRARIWNAEWVQLRNSLNDHRRPEAPPMSTNANAYTKEGLETISRLQDIRSEVERTFGAFEVLWTQYALWVNNELRDFREEVISQAEDLAMDEADLRMASSSESLSNHEKEQERLKKAARGCFRVGPDYAFSRYNMALILPEQGRLLNLDNEDNAWPDMFRFLTFLASLGLPFFRRCAAMEVGQRRQMLSSVFLYLCRLPAHRIPQFVLGELNSQHPASGREFPLLGAFREPYLHPTLLLSNVPFVSLSRLASHLTQLLRLPKWDYLDRYVVSKEAWEAILDKFATDVVRRTELPFAVSDSQWAQMRKPRATTGLRMELGVGCSVGEFVVFFNWAAQGGYGGLRKKYPSDSRSKVQLTAAQERMKCVGGMRGFFSGE
ncbi:hypothetical protein CkaCkLH20_07582 [Colletotrichum karsti]|uniref:F-box domain-containing protein n=1 Tax=Colletotrichum karsti TaxID=1095194 RepID=A0A9P6LIQ9_9PEZI|nr:uncharacterized protein CkaCkLH20_07582 [Colletotrichum karsti]KAF9874888.1 hypothetical protein CkaCkLH20_07582 [Colletotrichum karsti]